MNHQAIITLTTDFGTRDGFVGQMKGVILRIHPGAMLVDVTHEIEAFDILAGALVVKGLSRYYPAGTIHVAVVDPGVGGERRGIVLRRDGQIYVGPDNGLFTYILGRGVGTEAREIANADFMLLDPHPTFHGRDIFAPVAGFLSSGSEFESVGPRVADPVRLKIPHAEATEDGIAGEIIYIDRFGNLTSNIEAEQLRRAVRTVSIGDVTVRGIRRFFSEVEEARPLALINSLGLLEIALNRGDAAQALGLAKGARIRVVWDE
jgi:S-adenosyl-L-methionine hydrolase (adenosine-forming)